MASPTKCGGIPIPTRAQWREMFECKREIIPLPSLVQWREILEEENKFVNKAREILQELLVMDLVCLVLTFVSRRHEKKNIKKTYKTYMHNISKPFAEEWCLWYLRANDICVPATSEDILSALNEQFDGNLKQIQSLPSSVAPHWMGYISLIFVGKTLVASWDDDRAPVHLVSKSRQICLQDGTQHMIFPTMSKALLALHHKELVERRKIRVP